MEEKSDLKTKGLETYATDMVDAFQSGEPGLIKKMIHSQEQEELEKKKESRESGKNRLFAIFGAMFIVIALSVVVALYMFREEVEVVYVAPPVTPLILTDRNDSLDVTEMDRVSVLSALRPALENFDLAKGKIKSVFLNEDNQPVNFSRFIALTESSFPLEQATVVYPNFMLGSLGVSSPSDDAVVGRAFILLRTQSFVDVFTPMRTWERKMFFDLSPIFGILTTPDNEALITKDFEDGFVLNKNARMLIDNTGNVILMYVFLDDNFVLITNSKETVREVLIRLSLGEVRK